MATTVSPFKESQKLTCYGRGYPDVCTYVRIYACIHMHTHTDTHSSTCRNNTPERQVHSAASCNMFHIIIHACPYVTCTPSNWLMLSTKANRAADCKTCDFACRGVSISMSQTRTKSNAHDLPFRAQPAKGSGADWTDILNRSNYAGVDV